MNFTLVNYGGKTSLLIDGYVYHTVEFEFLKILLQPSVAKVEH